MKIYRIRWDVSGELVIEPRKEWYSIKQVALILDVSNTTAWRFVKQKKIEAQRIGGRWRVSYETLQLFLRKSRSG